MSKSTSENIIKKNSFLSRPIVNTLVKLNKVFNRINQLKVKLFAKEPVIDQELPVLNSLFKVDFSIYKKKFDEDGYIFIENCFDEDFINKLSLNWPQRMFFHPNREIAKTYDIGFRYLRGWKLDFENNKLRYFPYLKKFYELLISEEFRKNINQLYDEKTKVSCTSITTSTVFGGGHLFPHKDDIALDEPDDIKTKTMINCIWFINAKPNNSSTGGTGLYKDNDFKKLVFKPNNLNNTVLIYKTLADYWHGFDALPKGSVRYAVTNQISIDK